jgi:flagellar motor switch protein FliM
MWMATNQSPLKKILSKHLREKVLLSLNTCQMIQFKALDTVMPAPVVLNVVQLPNVDDVIIPQF